MLDNPDKTITMILGQPPSEKRAAIGYNMAARFYGPIIKMLESEQPHDGVKAILKRAFDFVSDPAITVFPPEVYQVVEECADKFRAHYEQKFTF